MRAMWALPLAVGRIRIVRPKFANSSSSKDRRQSHRVTTDQQEFKRPLPVPGETDSVPGGSISWGKMRQSSFASKM